MEGVAWQAGSLNSPRACVRSPLLVRFYAHSLCGIVPPGCAHRYAVTSDEPK